MKLAQWSVAYPSLGIAPRNVTIPHAWGQEVDVRWEGPAIYETTLRVPEGDPWLVFHGVSYEARVRIDGHAIGIHRGIWDRFEFSLAAWAGKAVSIQVEVVKNGGETFPVRDAASGFLPYVFHTFGGIFREVEIIEGRPADRPASKPRLRAEGAQLLLDGKPWMMRGVLSWGWYQDLGHPNPDDEHIVREIEIIKKLGFNLIKFCLWVPSHRYLELMADAGLEAWIELPLWDPSGDPEKLDAMAEEMLRIVAQYRHHPNVVLWTVGCELSDATSPDFRRRMVDEVRALTDGALVKDNSGGAEMYGGEPAEFGDFEDFHPYCDTPFYPAVLESLRTGPRPSKPILLGEFNDIDTHRDLIRIRRVAPYWASVNPTLNDVGVRWQHDLPGLLEETRWAQSDAEAASAALRGRSIEKAKFLRRFVQENVAQISEIAGFVVTGWIDTPISSAGFVDEWGEPKPGMDAAPWNREDVIFRVPLRRPPWVRGGNRPGWQDLFNHMHGRGILIQAGLRTPDDGEHKMNGSLCVGGSMIELEPLLLRRTGPGLGFASWMIESSQFAGAEVATLRLESGDSSAEWRLNFFDPFPSSEHGDWALNDPSGFFEGLRLDGTGPELATDLSQGLPTCGVAVATREFTVPMPFWRESALEFPSELGQALFARLGWEGLLAVSPDCALDLDLVQRCLGPEAKLSVGINRIDTRTYREHPILIEAQTPAGRLIVTSLRPFGGLGVQPYGVLRNPAGGWLLDCLMRWVASPSGV